MGMLSLPRWLVCRRPAQRACGWIIALCGLVAWPALAGSLQVSPILLEFAPDQQAQAVWLSNSGSEPIRAQVRVRAWTQSVAGDVLGDTDLLAASPPILEIAPGERQLVRIVRIGKSLPDRERPHRLLVDELPASEGTDAGGLQFLLRYSVPVFLLPTGATAVTSETGPQPLSDVSALAVSLIANGADAVLTLRNHGARRLRISQLVHVAADGQRTALVPGLLGYALSGQEMSWTLPQAAAVAAGGSLKAKFNDDQQEQALPLPGAGR